MNEFLLSLIRSHPTLRVEIEIIGESTFYGFTKNQSASTANPVWLIARVTRSGTLEQVLWASQKFDQIYDNRVSLFANPPFANQKSILFGRVDSNDKILLVDDASLTFTHLEAVTISVWFRTAASAAQAMFSKQQGSNNAGYRLSNNSGRIEWHMSGGAGTNRQFIRTPNGGEYNDDNWHHIVMIKPANADAANVIFVVDGVDISGTLDIQNNTLSSTPANSTPGQISGRNNGNTETMNGFLDEIAVFRTALTVVEAQAIFGIGEPLNLGSHAQALNMPGWWRMGESDTFPTITNLGTAGATLNGTMTDMKASDIVGETANVS